MRADAAIEARANSDADYEAKQREIMEAYAEGEGKEAMARALNAQQAEFDAQLAALQAQITDLQHDKEILEHKVETIPELQMHLDEAQGQVEK